jgi:hypothetical protein
VRGKSSAEVPVCWSDISHEILGHYSIANSLL